MKERTKETFVTRRKKPNTSSQQPAPAQQPTSAKGRWYKADLHVHTPASRDYEEPRVTYLEWLRKVVERGLEIVAVTDHNTVAGVGAIRRELEWLTRLEQQGRLNPEEQQRLDEWRTLGDRVMVLPGFEFTATFGFHILALFPPETSLRHLEHVLLDLKIPPGKLDEGSTETGATTDVLAAYRIIRAGRRLGDRRACQQHPRRGHAQLSLRRPDQDRLHPGSQPGCAGGHGPGPQRAFHRALLQRHKTRISAPHALLFRAATPIV